VARVEVAKRLRVIDQTGRDITPPEVDHIGLCSEGLLRIWKGRKQGYMNGSGDHSKRRGCIAHHNTIGGQCPPYDVPSSGTTRNPRGRGCVEPLGEPRVRNGAVDMTRPLCPHPQVAVYSGTDSTNEAANFSCKNP